MRAGAVGLILLVAGALGAVLLGVPPDVLVDDLPAYLAFALATPASSLVR